MPAPGGASRSAFGDLLKQARRRLELNHQQLAERIGVSRGSVYAWEQGHIPQRTRLPAIAAALELELEDLVASITAEPGSLQFVPFNINSSVPARVVGTGSGKTEQFMLEISGIRLNFPLQQIPIYVRVTIGAIESEVSEQPHEPHTG